MDAIFFILSRLLFIFQIALIARALLSWFDPRGANPISRFLIEFTEPVVAPVRSIMPRTGMIDLSIFVTLMLIWILQRMLAQAVVA